MKFKCGYLIPLVAVAVVVILAGVGLSKSLFASREDPELIRSQFISDIQDGNFDRAIIRMDVADREQALSNLRAIPVSERHDIAKMMANAVLDEKDAAKRVYLCKFKADYQGVKITYTLKMLDGKWMFSTDMHDGSSIF